MGRGRGPAAQLCDLNPVSTLAELGFSLLMVHACVCVCVCVCVPLKELIFIGWLLGRRALHLASFRLQLPSFLWGLSVLIYKMGAVIVPSPWFQ